MINKTGDNFKVIQKAIIRNNGKILLLKRADDDEVGGLWDFAGGKLELFEEMEKGLRREIREETGLEVSNVKILKVKEKILRKRAKHLILILYEAKANFPKIKLSKEHSKYLWINEKEINNYKIIPTIKIMLGK